MKKILKVSFVKTVDSSPDLSFLGEYTDKPEDWAIVRRDGDYLANLEKNENWERPERTREYRFFKPYAGDEPAGTPDYQKNGMQDYARMEAMERGEWSMLFCYTQATVEIKGLRQTLRSGGLGGVESDSDDGHFAEIKEEQLMELRDVLDELGFTADDIFNAFKNVKDEDA